MYVRMYVCMYVCMYVYKYVYVHIYIYSERMQQNLERHSPLAQQQLKLPFKMPWARELPKHRHAQGQQPGLVDTRGPEGKYRYPFKGHLERVGIGWLPNRSMQVYDIPGPEKGFLYPYFRVYVRTIQVLGPIGIQGWDVVD